MLTAPTPKVHTTVDARKATEEAVKSARVSELDLNALHSKGLVLLSWKGDMSQSGISFIWLQHKTFVPSIWHINFPNM